MEKMEIEYLKRQEEFAIYFLTLLLKHPSTKGAKIKIDYVEDEDEDEGGRTEIWMKRMPVDYFHVILRYQNEFFITVWDGEYRLDFRYSFRTGKLLNLIPMKIRNAMIKLYKQNGLRKIKWNVYVSK